ncbi:hypothetical protein NL53_00815 [Vibrio variabilis]|uniref:Lcl C-terminal domain-containing protein n=1 Tax=Vibrio variabilis TaxID=990271 RepID=A0ABR4YGL5_9VIBR|nr:hypothetical protein NL53_00815 [Vibrio variabilis]
MQEPSSGSRINYVDVALSKALSSDLTLTINTKPISAQDSGQFKNYEPVTALSFIVKAGDTQAKLPLSVVNNNLYESGVTLAYTVSAPPSTEYVIKSDKSVITIENTDALPTIRFNAPNRTLLEGDTKSFALSLDHYSRYPVSVTLETSGTASTDDYSDTLDDSKIVTIPAEKLSLSFNVSAKKDTISEGAEGLRYTLKNPSDVNVVDKENTLDIYIPGDKRFNDTGFVTRYNGTEFGESNTQPEYPNQDADFGLDISPDMTHDDGRYGFSYSKFDIHGNLVPLTESKYHCVRDNTTGLYIENKPSDPVDLPLTRKAVEDEQKVQRDDPDNYVYPNEPDRNYVISSENWQHSTYLYTWYEKDSALNGGSEGAKNMTMPEEVPIDYTCAISQDSSGDRRCDTAAYLSQMNRFSICGFTDWRLPTPTEMKSLVSFNVDNNDNNNRAFLKFIHGKTYFTSATNAERNGSAWCVNTVSGQTKLCNKGSYNSVIAVSGGKE